MINSFIFNFLMTLAPILLLAGILGVVATSARHRLEEDEPGIGTVRRLLAYGAALAGLLLLIVGASLLLRTVLVALTGDDTIAGDETALLALGLALSIVGAPVWLASWLILERSTGSHPVEHRTLSRKVYLHFVLAASGLATVFSSLGFLSTLGRDGGINEMSLAIAIFAGLAWAYHWRVQEREGQLNVVTMTIRRIYLYGMSLVGVLLAFAGIGSVMTLLMSTAYDSLFDGNTLIVGRTQLWNGSMQSALAQVLVGGLVAWWHWFRAASADAGSWMRSIYLYPIAILGGAIAVVASSSVGLYHLLQWLFGDPDPSSAVAHFDVFPGLVSVGLVGAAVWVYHWQVAKQEASSNQPTADSAARIYNYLVSALGMGTLAVAVVMLFALFLGLISPSGQPNLHGDLWRNPLALTLTLLAVGLPVWLSSWRKVQLAAGRLGVAERDAVARRIFIYGTFGVALAASLINLSIVLFNLFEMFLEDRPAGRLIWDSRWSIAILLAAGVATAYFWQVLKEDRQAIRATGSPGEVRGRRKRVTVIAPAGSREFLARIEAALGPGSRLIVWRAETGLASVDHTDTAEFERMITAVQDSDSDQVLLIADGGRLQVLPYED